MATLAAHPSPRRRRPRPGSVALIAFAAVLATAVIVNGASTVRGSERVKLDRKAAAHWIAAHRALGRFGPPRIHVGKRHDLACAARRPAGGDPYDGRCLVIGDAGTSAAPVLRAYRCFYPRAAQHSLPTSPPCVERHGNSSVSG